MYKTFFFEPVEESEGSWIINIYIYTLSTSVTLENALFNPFYLVAGFLDTL